jgi:hypothetical protein
MFAPPGTLIQRHGTIEDHVERRALLQVDLFGPAQQHRRQPDAAADPRADTRSLPAAARARSIPSVTVKGPVADQAQLPPPDGAPFDPDSGRALYVDEPL